MSGKNILVLGGGAGGLVVANELRKRLGKEHKIILIDKNTKHIFNSSFVWVLMGWREPSQVQKSLEKLNKKKIEYVNAEILQIDPANRLVKTSVQDFAYDYLVISLGADLALEAVPGFAQSAHNFYDLNGVIKLRDALKGFSSGKLIVLISSLPFKCPAAPYEAAFLMDYYYRERGMRGKIDLRVYTPEPQPMPVAGPAVGNAMKQMLEMRGINYNPNFKVTSIDSEKREITFEKGEKVKYDFLVGIPPHRSPKVVKEAGLTDESGWIPVNRETLNTKYDEVYAIGDVTAVRLPDGKKMLPKAGVFAHYQAEAVAHNIDAEISGSGTLRKFDGKGSCFIEIGYSKAAYGSGNFYAEPAPAVKMREPGRIWHWGKILFEKWWFWHWF